MAIAIRIANHFEDMIISYSLTQRRSCLQNPLNSSHIFLVFFCIFSSISLIKAQAPKNSPYTWGEIPLEHLEMTVCSFDSSAAAVILSDFGEWKLKSSGKNLGFKATLDRHVRIKILNEGGFDWAEGELNWLSVENFEKIKNFKGQTINLEDGNVVIYPLEKNNVVQTNQTDNYSSLKYNFPKVVSGSVIEFTYTLVTSDIVRLKPWYFQADIPTLRSEMRLNRSKDINHSVVLYYANQSVDGKKDIWIMENLSALRDEPFVNNLENYRSRAEFEIKEYAKKIYSRFGSVTYKADLYNSWEEFNWKFSPSLFLHFPSDDIINLKAFVDTLIADVPDTLDRMKLIYNFVRDSMEWNRKYGIRADVSLAPDVLARGEGSSAEINTLLRLMLEMADIPCAGMVLATVDYGLPVDQPIISQFNQYIVAASAGGETFFLNATDPMRPYDLPDMNDLAQAGYLLQREKSGWMSIPNHYQAGQDVNGMVRLDSSGSLEGKIMERYGGYYAVEMRTLFEKTEDKGEFWKGMLRESNTETEIFNQSIEHANDPDEPLTLTYELKTNDFARTSGNYIYVNPLMDLVKRDNPFLDSERNFDIEFGCLHVQRVFVAIEIPEGYEIESLPESKRVVMSNSDQETGDSHDVMIFQYSCQQTLNQIQILSEFMTTKATFPAEVYPSLKEIYDHMLAKHSEQIVLKRKGH